MSTARRLSLMVLLLVALANYTGDARTTAYYTARATSGSNTLSAGSIILTKGQAGAVFSVSGLYPGQSTSAIDVTLQNDGSLDLRYSMTTAVTSDSAGLAASITLTVREGTCATSGPVLYAGALDQAALALRPATPIAAGGADALCFQAALSASAPSSLQNRSTTVTFNFRAEQAVQR